MDDVKLIVFDFDGTLMDTADHVTKYILRVIDKFNLKKVSVNELISYRGGTFIDTLKKLEATDEDVIKINNSYNEMFLENIDDIKLFDYVNSTLDKLKKSGYILGIATNRDRESLVPLLKYFNIYKYFDKIITISDVKRRKPYPDMILKILYGLDIEREQVLVVGDTFYDIELGKNTGCKTCLVNYNKVDKKIDADYVVYKFNQILDILG